MLAVLSAALMPLPAASQVNPEAAARPEGGATYKYEVYGGVAYSRIRQVPVSYSGLLGGKVSLARNWGKYFQLMGSGDYYTVGTGHSGLPSPGHPTIYTFLAWAGDSTPTSTKTSAAWSSRKWAESIPAARK